MTDENDPTGSPPSEEPREFRFHYLKSNLFRVVHADGVHGGLTPRGLIQANFYSERHPIPKMTVHSVINGRIGKETREARVTRDGAVREVEVGVVFDLSLAKNLIKWLQEKIDAVEKAELPNT